MSASCEICDRIADWRTGRNAHFVHEFEHAILVVGDHQFHRGYCVMFLKTHHRDLHDLPAQVQQGLFAELMTAARAIQDAFHPWKLNYACYGNLVQHVHWHIFPRYASDPERTSNPWIHADQFKDHRTDEAAAKRIAETIRAQLAART